MNERFISTLTSMFFHLSPALQMPPICLIFLHWFCRADRLTSLVLLYEGPSLFYMRGPVSHNILFVIRVSLLFQHVFAFIFISKIHFHTVYEAPCISSEPRFLKSWLHEKNRINEVLHARFNHITAHTHSSVYMC